MSAQPWGWICNPHLNSMHTHAHTQSRENSAFWYLKQMLVFVVPLACSAFTGCHTETADLFIPAVLVIRKTHTYTIIARFKRKAWSCAHYACVYGGDEPTYSYTVHMIWRILVMSVILLQFKWETLKLNVSTKCFGLWL